MEYYRKHRPDSLASLIGQETVVNTLTAMKRKTVIPHCLLLTGPSGTGKTTVARILKAELECSDTDFQEMNCADVRGIDNVRDIRSMMGMSPMGGRTRIWLIDEAHKLTNDAQNALLKMLEDTPAHVFFFLATTEPTKLLATVRSRCTELKFKALAPKDLELVIGRVCNAEQLDINDGIVDSITVLANGNARTALVMLEQVMHLKSKAEQAEAIEGAARTPAFSLCQTLVKARPQWKDVSKILATIEGEPEGLRQMVMAYFNSVLLGPNAKNHAQAAQVLENFCPKQFFSKAEFTLACWRTCWEINSGT